MLAGGVILLAGTFLLSSMSADVAYWQVTLYMVLCGLGLGPAMPLYTLAIQNAVAGDRIGQATSANQFFRQIGGTVGTALMRTVLASMLAGAMAGGTGQGGVAETEAGIRAGFAEQSALIERVVRGRDQGALEQRLQSPQLSQAFKVQLETAITLVQASTAAQDDALRVLRAQLDAETNKAVAQAKRTVKITFTVALTRVFLYSAFFVMAGLLFTLLIPDLRLHTTLATAPQAAD